MQAEAAPDINVNVATQNDLVTVDASILVPVSIEQAWAVLNDYDRMGEFIPNLQSRIISREPLRVEQKKTSGFGPFKITFESVWEIELTPYQLIQTRALSGDVESMHGITKLSTEGTATRIDYHLEGMPKFWVPVIGPSVIKSDVRERLQGAREEMLRRKSRSKNHDN
ncbi:MAG: SRPBCC family protein [Burkholderiales bacterium]